MYTVLCCYRKTASYQPLIRSWFILNYVKINLPSVLWCCWLGVRKSIWPVKIERWGTGLVISVWSEVQVICISSCWCHCHPSISCFIKIQIVLTFLVPAYPPVVLKKRPLNGCLMLKLKFSLHHCLFILIRYLWCCLLDLFRERNIWWKII